MTTIGTSSETAVLYGPLYSAYVRAARIALEEKGVAYRLEPVDIFGAAAEDPAYLARHPFARVPAFEHDGFALYETVAIAQYVDEAFEGPPLQPAAPRARARMTQAIHVLDSYGYWPWVRVIFVQRVEGPRRGGTDEAAIAEALPAAARALDAIDAIKGEAPWLAGTDFSLADCQAAPMIDYLSQAEEGRALLAERPRLAAWWSALAARPAVRRTRCLIHELDADAKARAERGPTPP